MSEQKRGETLLAEGEHEQELARIADKIVALAEANKGERQPYLVSALGIDLGEDLRKLKLLTNKGLNEFIQSRLADRVTLVRLGAHRNVTAIIVGTADSNDTDTLQLAGGEQKKRFQYRFWAAFSVPPKADIRVFNLEDFTFDDVALADVPEGALTIDHALIAPTDADNRDEAIKANIAKWLEAHGLPEDRFIAPKRLPRSPIVASGREGASLLEAMLAALDRRQLQSISLSLDVIQTLLRAPRS